MNLLVIMVIWDYWNEEVLKIHKLFFTTYVLRDIQIKWKKILYNVNNNNDYWSADLRNKNVLITGGNDLGKQICNAFLKQGSGYCLRYKKTKKQK